MHLKWTQEAFNVWSERTTCGRQVEANVDGGNHRVDNDPTGSLIKKTKLLDN